MALVNFEIAFRNEIDKCILLNRLASFLRIPTANIVDLNSYWDLEDSLQRSSLGVTVDYSRSGLQSLLRGVGCLPLESELLGDLALYLAMELKTEVVIDDYTYHDYRAQDRSLIYFPNGSCARCIDKWEGVNEVNEVEIVPFGLLTW